VAPGIILKGQGQIEVLISNITSEPINIKKKQVIAYLHINPNREVANIIEIGNFDKLGIPTEVAKSIHSLIPREILEGLPPEQKDKALKLFKKYRQAFSEDDLDLGCAEGIEHTIDTGDHRPICQRPIRRSKHAKNEVNVKIQKLLDTGLLIHSNSPWASPMLIVKKKDGSNRVVIDYRKLNDISKKDSYPLPRIDNALDKLGGAKYFSAMDLISGYWQIDLPKKDQEKCAIITQQGLYQPTQMPQGLCNAPATFQRAMDIVLANLKVTCVLVYLDDINVFSRTFNEHLSHLEEVFKRLIKANLKLKPRKCHFFKEQIEYLGYLVDQDGLKPQPQKIEAMQKLDVPKSRRDIQVFLGMVGYYRQFIKNFSQIAEPLFYLLKGDSKFIWTLECQEAFEELKNSLVTAPVLAYPDFTKKFIVQTDASLTAIGGVLSQISDDGEEHPVAYCSRTLNIHERNYTVTERECLAVIYSCKQFRVYLHGQEFTVVTDHSSLQWLRNLKEPEGRLARWALKMQAYNYNIIHKAGIIHQNADGLSRLPAICHLEGEAGRLYDLLFTPDNWENEPEEIQKILKKLSADTEIIKGQLFKKVGDQLRLFVKPNDRMDVIKNCHNAIGHGGPRKTIEKICQDYYWESIAFDVADYINHCLICNSDKPFKPATQFEFVKPNFAFHTISMDLIGPLPSSNNNHKYIIVAIDHLTKWVEARSVKDLGALTVSKFVLEQIINRHGCPQFILTDNATNFTSHMLPKLNELMAIRGVYTTPYHPESNGTVERVNGTLEKILRKLVINKPS
jgi:hypothetical protein